MLKNNETISYRINCFCEDYSEVDALDMIRLRFELENNPKNREGIIYLEKAIEHFVSLRSCQQAVNPVVCPDCVQSERLTPKEYSVES